MTKVLSYYKSKNVNIVIITSLIVSIIITNSFVIFSPDENTRFYNAGLTSAITVGVALVICLVQVYRYKRSVHRQEKTGQPHYYFDNTIQEQKVAEVKRGEGKTTLSSPLVAGTSSVWILLLSIAMMLSTIGDTGYAYSAAYGPSSVQRDVWIWDVIYNADHLCLAVALIGYRHFFSFNRQNALQY